MFNFLVANDAECNALWINRGDGTFEDRAVLLGLAVNGEGTPEANMGIAYGDSDGDARPDVAITHFFGERTTLWCARGDSGGGPSYQDETAVAGLPVDTRNVTGWGTVFADFDHDGRLDLMATNGHIRPEPTQVYSLANPPILFRNRGRGRFANVNATAGGYFQSLHVGRGLACGDLDDDGDLDLVVVHHFAPSVVLWNETRRRGNWLMVELRGRGLNRDAVGARLTARVGPLTLVRTVDGGGSYISASDRRVHFGLGDATHVDRLEVRWPSGQVEVRSDLPANGTVEWAEAGSGSASRGQPPINRRGSICRTALPREARRGAGPDGTARRPRRSVRTGSL